MTAKTELKLENYVPDLAELDEAAAYNGIYRYYDDDENFDKLRQRDMPTKEHNDLKRYLIEILLWYYRAQKCTVYDEFHFYETQETMEEPLYPDIAVIKEYLHQEGTSNYELGVTGPTPSLIIELILKKTRAMDVQVDRKPARYANWGVKEYFAYDPRPRKRKHKMPRLWGWRLDTYTKINIALEPDELGRIWSEQLDSWLVPDGEMLRLYDKDGNIRLTRAEYATQRAERLAERLRELGEDPDKL